MSFELGDTELLRRIADALEEQNELKKQEIELLKRQK